MGPKGRNPEAAETTASCVSLPTLATSGFSLPTSGFQFWPKIPVPLPRGRDLVQRWSDDTQELSSVELKMFAQEEERTEAEGRGGMRGEEAPASVKAAKAGSQWGGPGRGVVTPEGRTPRKLE